MLYKTADGITLLPKNSFLGIDLHWQFRARIYRPDFAKTSPKRLFSMTENERFGLDFAKTCSINSGTGLSQEASPVP